ncbi:MAG: hypothetical protein AAGF57_20240 [Pseudomonadota bacterium]
MKNDLLKTVSAAYRDASAAEVAHDIRESVVQTIHRALLDAVYRVRGEVPPGYSAFAMRDAEDTAQRLFETITPEAWAAAAKPIMSKRDAKLTRARAMQAIINS